MSFKSQKDSTSECCNRFFVDVVLFLRFFGPMLLRYGQCWAPQVFFQVCSPQIRNGFLIFLIRNRKSAIGRLKAYSATASPQRRFRILESAIVSPQLSNS